MRVAMSVAAILIASPAAAEDVGAYKDPAIALCEDATKAGRPDGAQRTEYRSHIEGAYVIVEYSESIMGTKPRQKVNRCKFQYDPDLNAYVSAPILVSVPTDCEQRSVEYRRWEIAFYSGSQPPSADVVQGFKRAEARSAECTDAKLDNDYERTRADVLDRVWRGTGIYPIAPADTALRQ